MTPLPLTLLALTTLVTTPTSATPVPSAATPGVPALPLVALDMSPEAFDDRYRGCGRAMARALPALTRSEQRGPLGQAWAAATEEWHRRGTPGQAWAAAMAEWHRRGTPGEAWAVAKEEWHRRGTPASPLSPAQALALLSYTSPLPLHRAFNAAVRVAGRSPRDYRDNFHFKALHFLLTQALETLRGSGGQQVTPGDPGGGRCLRVFRGVRGLRFRAPRGALVRFGHFASASLSNQSARSFGTDTLFQVLTCQGAPIARFSFFPLEAEVLIPPFETFQVTDVTWAGDTTVVALSSRGTFSRYNCEWLRGQRCGDEPCEFESDRSVPGALPHLGGLLLATTALAVATGTL